MGRHGLTGKSTSPIFSAPKFGVRRSSEPLVGLGRAFSGVLRWTPFSASRTNSAAQRHPRAGPL